MRWIRLLTVLFTANFRSKLTVTEESIIKFRVWLTDVDASVMNHAAMMSALEMGRIDLMVRTGFFKLARKKKWYFPSGGISVQFLRPLKLFEKAYIKTRVFHMNDRWLYIEQKIMRLDKEIALCIVKSTVKKGRETVNNQEIAKQLGITEPPVEARELVDCYEHENKLVKERLCNKM